MHYFYNDKMIVKVLKFLKIYSEQNYEVLTFDINTFLISFIIFLMPHAVLFVFSAKRPNK